MLAQNQSLPPGLESLTVRWRLHSSGYWPTPIEGQLPELMNLRDTLLVQCPRLKALWLDAYYFFLQWRKWPDGSLDERFASNMGE